MNHHEDHSYTSTSDVSEGEDPIDLFFQNNLDEIIDMFYEFQERFSHNPFFLQRLESSHLTDLFIDCLFGQKTHQVLNESNCAFYTEYQPEVDTSFTIAYSFLYRHRFKLSHALWVKFCYEYTIV